MAWEVTAVKYAENTARTRRENFLWTDAPDLPSPIDYYVWVLRNGTRTILVDTGFDHAEAKARRRPVLRDPGEALAPLGLTPDAIDTVICTHLHYDHAGGLHHYPNAHIHLQAAEMAFATGPCMCETLPRYAYTAGHVCEAVKRLYAGKLTFHDGDGEVAPGVTVHLIGGHTRGMQAVRVETAHGPLCLASDAAHFYENALQRNPFLLVIDLEDMYRGYDRVLDLAGGDARRMIPGHDPLVGQLFDQGPAPWTTRLDPGPAKDWPF